VVNVGEVSIVAIRDITEDQATAAGATSVKELVRTSDHGTWTLRTLYLIKGPPGRSAESLRGDMDGDMDSDMDKAVFKRNVRKLKFHRLTRSLPEGYELSPRGSAYSARRESGDSSR
jgi:hypothetical protein